MASRAAPSLSPRAARTRAALVDAGLKLFAARPVDAVAIDEIVALARVAKGSFFNHFADKQAFAAALSTAIRGELEQRVGAANAAIADPLERLSRGMLVGVDFALDEPERTLVMLGSMAHSVAATHPLNAGLLADLEACAEGGHIGAEARRSGLLLWIGACNVLMLHALERRAREDTAKRLRDVMQMALIGLGADPGRSAALAAKCADLLAADKVCGATLS